MKIFISHSSMDADCGRKVCGLLEQAGHHCFIAPRDIPAGREYAGEIMRGIEDSDVLVLLLSNHSNQSPHVLREVEHAVSKSVPIAVYKLEEVQLNKSMEYFIMTHQWLNQKPGEDLRVIVDCVNHLEKSSGQLPAKNIVSTTKDKKMIVSLAAVLMLVVLAAGIFLWQKYRYKTSQPTYTLSPGETVTLGAYNQEPVTWRVIHLSEDGTRAVLISEHIVTMKAYDAAGSEKFNAENGKEYWSCQSEDFEDRELEARVRGNSDWKTSNIRTWLNSDREIVSYEGDKPSNRAMSEQKNGYENEAGFLNGFTEEERSVILETEVETRGNLLVQDQNQVTADRVFLLSREELKWLEEADVNFYATPTEAAVAQDATHWYQIYSREYGVDTYYWWLRDTAEDCVSQCYIVTNGYKGDVLSTRIVGTEGFGIRPAVTIDVEAFGRLQSKTNP